MTATSRIHRLLWAGGAALLVMVLDVSTKWWIQNHFFLHQSQPVLGNVLRFTYVLNPNAIFGLPLGNPWLYYTFGILAIGVLLTLLLLEHRVPYLILYGLILGGALGNLLNRIWLGAVVDFIDVGIGSYRWYVFNVADAAISTSLVLLLVLEFLPRTGSDTSTLPDESFHPEPEETG